MEFFLGFLVTVVTAALVAKRYQDLYANAPQRGGIEFSQTRKFMLAPGAYFDDALFNVKAKTQASEFIAKNSTRILVLADQAYWIKDNALYVANFTDRGVDSESAKVVDTMAMDDVELKKIIYVIDKLTEGSQIDPGDTGN